MLTGTEAPNLDTRALIMKPDNIAKTVDFGVSTILAEQIKYLAFATVRSWLRKEFLNEKNTRNSTLEGTPSIIPRVRSNVDRRRTTNML